MILLSFFSSVALGCVSFSVQMPMGRQPCSSMTLSRLFFGANIPEGGVVSEAEWQTFLKEIATPRFPEGLTVIEGRGQWQGENGVIEKETSHVLEILNEGDSEATKKIDEIIGEYKSRFHQEAVLLVKVPVTACL